MSRQIAAVDLKCNKIWTFTYLEAIREHSERFLARGIVDEFNLYRSVLARALEAKIKHTRKEWKQPP